MNVSAAGVKHSCITLHSKQTALLCLTFENVSPSENDSVCAVATQRVNPKILTHKLIFLRHLVVKRRLTKLNLCPYNYEGLRVLLGYTPLQYI